MIDDEQGYFLGSQDQANQFARGQKFALDSIPQGFREDYTNAAFAIVYDDCDQWQNMLEAFYKGSPREQDFQILGIQPTTILKDGCPLQCHDRSGLHDSQIADRIEL